MHSSFTESHNAFRGALPPASLSNFHNKSRLICAFAIALTCFKAQKFKTSGRANKHYYMTHIKMNFILTKVHECFFCVYYVDEDSYLSCKISRHFKTNVNMIRQIIQISQLGIKLRRYGTSYN